MAAGNCAAGVSHQHTTRRRHRPQQRGKNSTATTMTAATARTRHHRCVRPHLRGVIPCNLRRHADAICIQAKAQPKVVKQLVAGADKNLINTLSEYAPKSSIGTWSCSPIRSSPCPGMRTPWEPSDCSQWVSAARRPCWWTEGSRGCWPALWHRCFSRPCLLSWAVWALRSGSWSDAGVRKRVAPSSATFSTTRHESACGSSSSSARQPTSPCRHRHHHHHHHHQHAKRTAAVCHPEMDPGKAGHILRLVGESKRTSSSSSAHRSRSAEQGEEKNLTSVATAGPGGRSCALAGRGWWGHAMVGLGRRPRGFEALTGGAPGHPQSGLGSTACGAKTATTGPPLRPRHDPPTEWLQVISHARRGTWGGQCAEDTATGCGELERSLALYQRRLQQVLGLTRVEAHTEQRRRRLKVVGQLPVAGCTLGAAGAGYEGKDEGEEVPSTISRRLTFTPQEEREQERQLAWVWWNLESQAAAILPKTVRERVLALLRWLTDGGYISWRPDTLELIVDGIEYKGANLVDLAGHVLRQHQPGNRRR